MKSVFGLDEKFAAALSYVLGPISGIVVLVIERENRFVRFHALQSTLWFLFMWIVYWVIRLAVTLITGIPFSIGTILGFVLSPVIWVVMAVFWLIFIGSRLFLMMRAAMGHEFKLPYVGEVAWNQVNK